MEVIEGFLEEVTWQPPPLIAPSLLAKELLEVTIPLMEPVEVSLSPVQIRKQSLERRQGSHGVYQVGERTIFSLSLSLSLVLVCTLLSRARKVWAPDIRGDPHSFSPTVILRAPSMPRALEAEPAGCLACELRGPAFHPKPCLQTPFRMLLPGPPGNSDICSQDSPGGSIYVGPGLATVPGEERVNNIPTLCLPLPIPFASCKSWYGGPPRTSFSGT